MKYLANHLVKCAQDTSRKILRFPIKGHKIINEKVYDAHNWNKSMLEICFTSNYKFNAKIMKKRNRYAGLPY